MRANGTWGSMTLMRLMSPVSIRVRFMLGRDPREMPPTRFDHQQAERDQYDDTSAQCQRQLDADERADHTDREAAAGAKSHDRHVEEPHDPAAKLMRRQHLHER